MQNNYLAPQRSLQGKRPGRRKGNRGTTRTCGGQDPRASVFHLSTAYDGSTTVLAIENFSENQCFIPPGSWGPIDGTHLLAIAGQFSAGQFYANRLEPKGFPPQT